MMLLRTLMLVGLLVSFPAGLAAQQDLVQWGQWRGPLSTGGSPQARPPLRWSETENVRWKVEVPGHGLSSPIVWDDRVYLTTAVPIGEELEPRYSGAPGAHDNLPVTHRHRFAVLAFDRTNGDLLWEKTVCEALPHEGGHYTGSLASFSPVTNGTHIVASFGTRGLYCLDREGEVLWQRDLGVINTKHGHGEGSSPALRDGIVIVNSDHEGDSYIAAYDVISGDRLWRQPRDEVTSWSSPIVIEHEGRAQAVVAGTDRVRGYDLHSGEIIWECGGLSNNVVASPVYADGMVLVGSSYDTRAIMGIRIDGAAGDVTGTDHVVWSSVRLTPYVPSLLLYDGHVYYLRHYQGVLSRVNAATGEAPSGPFRLPAVRNIYASPVAAEGRVYITDLDGTTLVMSAGDEPEFLAINRLDDEFGASAALVGPEMFLRGKRFLYCLSEQ